MHKYSFMYISEVKKMSEVRKELQITNLNYYKFQYKFHILVGDVDCGTVV